MGFKDPYGVLVLSPKVHDQIRMTGLYPGVKPKKYNGMRVQDDGGLAPWDLARHS